MKKSLLALNIFLQTAVAWQCGKSPTELAGIDSHIVSLQYPLAAGATWTYAYANDQHICGFSQTKGVHVWQVQSFTPAPVAVAYTLSDSYHDTTVSVLCGPTVTTIDSGSVTFTVSVGADSIYINAPELSNWVPTSFRGIPRSFLGMTDTLTTSYATNYPEGCRIICVKGLGIVAASFGWSGIDFTTKTLQLISFSKP